MNQYLGASVICARATPKQKAMVVHSVKVRTPSNQVVAAIGDGANDVPMIMEAHVGIGINGNEGLQAVNNSDFAIVRFFYIRRLIQIHGYASNTDIHIPTPIYHNNKILVVTLGTETTGELPS